MRHGLERQVGLQQIRRYVSVLVSLSVWYVSVLVSLSVWYVNVLVSLSVWYVSVLVSLCEGA